MATTGVPPGSFGSVTPVWGGMSNLAINTTADTIPVTTNTCMTIAAPDTAYIYNSNFNVSGMAGNYAGNADATFVSASSTDFGGSGTSEGVNGVCTSKLNTCIYDIIPK